MLGEQLSGSLIKFIFGFILIIVSVWWIIQGSSYIQPIKSSAIVTSRPALADTITVLNGSIPLFLMLVGLLIVWLEWDSLKIKKELAKEK